jgi:WD40 repeat protein
VDYEASGYLPNEPPEPISNINSPRAESPAAAGGDGTVDGTGDVNGDGDEEGGGMDVDDDDAPAPASEHAPTPTVPTPIPARMTLTLTNGQSVGVQSDKVTELGPETVTLSIPEKNVMHTVWNPRHTDILAAGGLGLCRIGIISNPPAGIVAPASDTQPPRTEPAEPPEPLQPLHPEQPIAAPGQDPNANPNPWQYVDILDPLDNTSMVSTMAWSPDGEILAVATQPGITGPLGTVTLRSRGGESIDEVPSAHDMVLKFLWNPSGSYLMWISSSGRDSSSLVVWNLRSSQALPPFPLDSVIMDAAWADDQSLTLCGHDFVVEAVIHEEAIVARHTRTDFDGEVRWTNIHIDSFTRTTVVVAEESAILGIIDASGDLHKTTAHEAEITALVFQPVPKSSLRSSSPRLLVTSSLDGTIKVWDARNPFSILHILSLGRSAPALAISFTPDGCLVAAANWHRIMIWNAEAGGVPKASWKGELSKWQSLPHGVDKDSGIGEEEDGSTHSLSWDADGKKLAYGLGSQVWGKDMRGSLGD